VRTDDQQRVIDVWFPCAGVDAACHLPVGSGKNEKAIAVWFASRPIAQARAAVTSALLDDDPLARQLIDAAVRGNAGAIARIADLVATKYPQGRPVVLDVFSGRGIIPLEAARIGARAVGIDLSPVATMAGRILADYALRDWSGEPVLPWAASSDRGWDPAEPRIIADLRAFLARVGEHTARLAGDWYPRSLDGSYPWGYLWAVSIPCDGCGRRFPLLGSLVLRHPHVARLDAGQWLRLAVDGETWHPEVADGRPEQSPTYSSGDRGDGQLRKGKSARCIFCNHVHSLETVKAKGFAGQYEDVILATAEDVDGKKIFRVPTAQEREVAHPDPSALPRIGGFSAIPDEAIPANNVHTVQGSGYGYRTFGSLMSTRQALQFAATCIAIRETHAEVLVAGGSPDYARALAAFAGSTLVRRLKRSTRGAGLMSFGNAAGTDSNNVAVNHVFSNESKMSFQFDWFETGLGDGPGTWAGLSSTGLKPYESHVARATGTPARFRTGNAMSLPYRDASVDAVITDPPYDDMIEYADASDLMFVWLRRALGDIEPDLFGHETPTQDGLQPKDDEIIVRRVQDPARVVHDGAFYESSLSRAFREANRVLRPDGRLVVVFGHSDPDAWRKLLAALHEAGYVVTSSWPSRTESANTGVASIRVTVTIGCRVAAEGRPVATAAEVDRDATELVKQRVPGWNRDGLALGDQMMAAYGPVMEVYGRYSSVIEPDGTIASVDRYLTLARRAVREATALRLESLPLETFDSMTRFAFMWMKLHGRTLVPKGEARFLAQADSLRIEDIRGHLVSESSTGFRLVLDPPKALWPESALFDVARAMIGGYIEAGSDGASTALAQSERPPDDEHLWALIGWLANELPASDPVAKAVAAIVRNGGTIMNAAKGIAVSREDADGTVQTTMFTPTEVSS
jgi:adenine-specific DNA methylase